jgi:hypothetical protein
LTPFPNVPSRELSESSKSVTGKPVLKRVVPETLHPSVQWLLRRKSRYPGRFPLLHIKGFKKGFPTSTSNFPYDSGPNPFAPVGQAALIG